MFHTARLSLIPGCQGEGRNFSLGVAPLWVCGGEAYLIQLNHYTGGRCVVPSSGLTSQKEKDTCRVCL